MSNEGALMRFSMGALTNVSSGFRLIPSLSVSMPDAAEEVGQGQSPLVAHS